MIGVQATAHACAPIDPRAGALDCAIYPALGGALDLGFFRLGGAGLGNQLLSWARGVALSERLDIPMIAPAWRTVRVGPTLRREKDRRVYRAFFNCEEQALAGMSKLAAFARPRHNVFFVDPSIVDAPNVPTLFITRPHVIAPHYFAGLIDHHSAISRRLLRMTQQPTLARLRQLEPIDVAVHVRLGDFPPPGTSNAPFNTQLPLAWYAGRIAAIRTALGDAARFTVCSDGTPDQLAALLAIPGVRLQHGETALVDLLSIAMSHALIASASTFSMWASFLGQMPTLCYPGALLQTFPSGHVLREESADGAPIGQKMLTALISQNEPPLRALLRETARW